MTGKVPKKKTREGVDDYGRTPLHYAAGKGQASEVIELLAVGADANAQDDNGWTPLHFAAQAVSPECTSELLRAGANPSLQDRFGNTPLFRAVFDSKGNGSVIKLLRKAGADPGAKNNHGVSPVSLARTIANYNVAQYFADVTEDEQR
jgi:ankyrin repeat protein